MLDQTEPLLDIAHQSARAIAEEAIFHGGRCNWIGASVREGRYGQVLVDYRSLDGSVYEGTAGLAIFLAETATATSDADLAATALAAARHAMDTIAGTPPAMSFYLGDLGVIAAATYVGTLLADEELRARAEDRHNAALSSTPDQPGFDLLSGAAGSILGLLAISDPDDARTSTLLTHYAETLTASAERHADGLSWANPAVPSRGNLVGLSHGTTGVALALARLGHLTGNSRWTEAAMSALRYESGRFSSEHGNWPDLRAPRDHHPSQPYSYTAYWCHGAPGVIAARAAMPAPLDARRYSETAIAMSTTRRALSSMMSSQHNFSVCHGVAGVAEALLVAESAMGSREPDTPSSAHNLAEASIVEGHERYPAHGDRWPSGAAGSPNPSLFLGSAGPGRLALRLARPTIPTLLTPPAPLRVADP